MNNDYRTERQPMDRLSNLSDFEVADNSPDVRGWKVQSLDGRTIGKVDDLIVDTSLMKARYLLVDLDHDAGSRGRTDSDRHVLVPVDRADVDDSERHVRLDVAAASIATLPRFSGTVTPTYDTDYRQAVPPGTARTGQAGTQHAGPGGGEQRITRSAEELRIGRRQVPAGEVRVHKRVETEHVNEPVTRTREDVRVERRPASGRTDRAEIGEDEIRVPITEEEVVVEKRPVVKEELVIAKEQKTDRQHVEADVRKERVDVERVGRPADQDADRKRR